MEGVKPEARAAGLVDGCYSLQVRNRAPAHAVTARVYVERYDELTDSAAIREIEIAGYLKAWQAADFT